MVRTRMFPPRDKRIAMKSQRLIFQSLGILTLGAALSACDKGDDVKITPIAPGAQCADGGLLIDVNGETFVSCTGDGSSSVVSTPVAFGAEGNPCPGPATHVVIEVKGSAPTEAWICDETGGFTATKIASSIKGHYLGMIDAQVTTIEFQLACGNDTPEQEESLRESIAHAESLKSVINSCSPTLLNLAGEASDEVTEIYACLGVVVATHRTCAQAVIESDDACETSLDDCNTAFLNGLDECQDGASDAASSEAQFFSQLFMYSMSQCGGGFGPA